MAASNFEFDIEEMKCDQCFKYLSVKPIKDYEDGTVKCGRCCQEDDDGTISMLNCYDEKQLFKCHNRYSGCRQLFSSSQVRAHEQTCLTYTYNCPYCPETSLPTYLLEDHFMKFHRLFVLSKSTFHPSCDVDKQVFLYKLNDFYFFVECSIDGDLGQFRVESYALGDPNITLNFTINSEVKANLEVLDELHVPNSRQAIHLANNADRNWPFLTVSLLYKVDDIPYYVDDAYALNDDLPESTESMDEFRNVRAYENFQTICTRFGIDWPTKFDINDFPQNMYLSSDFLHVIRLKKWIGTEIYLHCYKCFINSCHGRVPGDFVKINCTLFFLCEICCEIERKEGKIVNYTGYINVFKKYKANYPRNFDCDVIYKELPDFEDSPVRYDCPFLFCDVSHTYNKLIKHLSGTHTVSLRNVPFHSVDLSSNDHYNNVIIWVMPYFVKVNFVANPNGWEVNVQFAHRQIVPRHVRTKVALYNMDGELTHVFNQNCKLGSIPDESIKFHCQLEWFK